MRKLLPTILGFALIFGVIAAPVSAFAQDDPRDKTIPVLELDEADVRDALKIIFRSVGANYSISNEVQGTVTVSMRDVPFETALRNVLEQVGATYRVEGGIYTIIPKPQINPLTTDPGLGTDFPEETSEPIVKIRIRSADPALIFAILAGTADVNTFPESSSNIGGGGGFGGFGGSSGGFGGQGGGFGGGGFGGGGFGGSSGGFGGSSGGFGGGSGGFGGGRGGGRGGF